jgi:hypothetical protein
MLRFVQDLVHALSRQPKLFGYLDARMPLSQLADDLIALPLKRAGSFIGHAHVVLKDRNRIVAFLSHALVRY